MLVLTVRHGGAVYIGDAKVIIAKAGRQYVKLAIDAPPEVRVRREKHVAAEKDDTRAA